MTLKAASERFITLVSSNLFLKIAFGWFIVQGIFFVLTTRIGLPPDENYHVTFIRLFTENGFLPFVTNQADYLALGEIVRTPFFLYHYLFGFMAMLIGTGDTAVLFMRFVNLLIGVGSLVLVYRIALELKLSRLARNLTVWMLAGTLMFVFVSASVSYDNLFIFLSLASVWLLLKLLHKVTARQALLLLVTVAAGSLVKVNFLPIAVAVLVILTVRYRRSFKAVWADVASSFGRTRWLNISLCVVLAALTFLIVHRYGYNLVKYQAYAPSCTQVQSVEACRSNALFVRNEMVFGSGRLNASKDPIEYAYDWVPLIQNRTYGVFAHETLVPIKITRAWLQVLVVVAVIAVIRMWRKQDRLITLVLGLALFYTAVLMAENYRIYLGSGRFDFAVHGRYLFAVLPLLYLVSNHYILRLFKNVYAQAAFIVVVIGMFFLASLPTYLSQTNPEWYRPSAAETLERVKTTWR
jgi:hypothetical protein